MMQPLSARQHLDLATAMAAERGLPAPASRKVVSFPALRPDDINMGEADIGGVVGLDLSKLIHGRLLVQGVSGAGKSWTLRRLLEQTFATVQQIVIDPEGEFRSLADQCGHLHVEAQRLDTAALASVARRARERRLSILLDISDIGREQQMRAVAAFLAALIDAPREHWHPAMVAIDEAHLFAPFGGQSSAASDVRKAAIGAVTDLMSRGRKRGLAGVLATQRLARLAKSVASEAHNFMVGLNTLDLDIRRAAETIGWEARKGFDRLPMLEPGDFVAVGPAFSRSPAVLRVGPVQSRHVGAAPTNALMAQSAADQAVRAENTLVPGLRAVRAFIRDPHFATAGRVWGALVPLLPEGARVSDLSAHLDVSPADLYAAMALLDVHGALEFLGDGADRAVRIAKGLRP